jgi:hypothetical protein
MFLHPFVHFFNYTSHYTFALVINMIELLRKYTLPRSRSVAPKKLRLLISGLSIREAALMRGVTIKPISSSVRVFGFILRRSRSEASPGRLARQPWRTHYH